MYSINHIGVYTMGKQHVKCLTTGRWYVKCLTIGRPCVDVSRYKDILWSVSRLDDDEWINNGTYQQRDSLTLRPLGRISGWKGRNSTQASWSVCRKYIMEIKWLCISYSTSPMSIQSSYYYSKTIENISNLNAYNYYKVSNLSSLWQQLLLFQSLTCMAGLHSYAMKVL